MSELGSDVDLDLALNVLAEAGKFCCEVLRPWNESGDKEGSRLENGTVARLKAFRTPTGHSLRQAGQAFRAIQNTADRGFPPPLKCSATK